MTTHANRSTERLQTAMLALSIGCLILTLIGCKARVLVLSESEAVSRVEQGKPFTPTGNGYFVPDARMHQILKELQGRVESLPPAK